MKNALLLLCLPCFLFSCVTSPINERNFEIDREPPGAGIFLILPVVGLPQLLNREYFESITYFLLTVGGFGTAIYSYGNSLDGLGDISIRVAMIAMTYSMVDGVATTLKRRRQYDNLLNELEDADAFVRVDSVSMDPVFSSLINLYTYQPVGKVVLKNNSSWDIENVRQSFTVRNYSDFATEFGITDTFEGETSIESDIFLMLNTEALELTEDTPLTGELSIYYQVSGQDISISQPISFTLFNKNAMTWDDDRKLASFITPNAAPVKVFARTVAQQFRSSRRQDLNTNVQLAAELYAALGVHGCVYIIDPNTPFIEFREEKTAVDYIQFPQDTLYFRSGDCDDLVSLFSALMESVGVSTALVTVPGHIFMAFDTEVDPDNYREITSDKGLIFEMNDSVWVPVEVTMVGGSFVEAWNSGARQIQEWQQKEALNVYETKEAWKLFEPVAVPDPGRQISVPSKEEISAMVDRDLRALSGE